MATDRMAAVELLLSKIHDLLVVIDPAGVIVDISDSAEGVLGYSRGEALGRSAFDFVHPDDHHLAVVEILREVENSGGRVPSLLIRLVHANGESIETEAHAFSALAVPSIGGVVIALRLVSSRPIGDRVMAAGSYLFSAMTTVATDGTMIVDRALDPVYASPSLARLLMVEELAFSQGFGTLVHDEDRNDWFGALDRVSAMERSTERVEVRFRRTDDTWLWLDATLVNLLEDSGVQGIVVHLRDVDERRRLEMKFRHLAHRDFLTGVANRFALIEELRQRTGDRLRSSGLLFVDLDGFKAVNDSHGHAAGDEVLVWVAGQMLGAVRPGDIVARIGGDEFCILCDEVGDPSELARISRRLSEAFESPATREIVVGASIGTAVAEADDVNGLELLARADRSMYEQKRLRQKLR